MPIFNSYIFFLLQYQKKDIFTKGESNVHFTVDWLRWLCDIAL